MERGVKLVIERSSSAIKLILWRLIALISAILFIAGLVYRNNIDLAALSGISILYSLLIFRAFLLDMPMHLGGFHLNLGNVLLRIYFLIFGILVWLVSFAVLLDFME